MEYLTDMVTKVPEGTSSAKVDELRSAEALRAAELAKAGHLIRLWRPPLGPGEWRSIGLFRAVDEEELRKVLDSLPLHIWMKVIITPLNPHPNDPEYSARTPQYSNFFEDYFHRIHTCNQCGYQNLLNQEFGKGYMIKI